MNDAYHRRTLDQIDLDATFDPTGWINQPDDSRIYYHHKGYKKNCGIEGNPLWFRRFGESWYLIIVHGDAYGMRTIRERAVNVSLMRTIPGRTWWDGWTTICHVPKIVDDRHIAPAQAYLADFAVRHAVKQKLALL